MLPNSEGDSGLHNGKPERHSLATPLTTSGSVAESAGSTLLAGVETLSERLAEAAPASEENRRVAPELVEELRRIGVFRMFAPAAVGGLDLPIVETMKILEKLAAADGSVGWISMIGCHGPLFFAQLEPSASAQIFADGPDVIGGGSVRPEGTARACEGGWRVDGKWGFASGCEHADWLYVWCVETGDDGPAAGSNGAPKVRMVVHPARAFAVLDTWDVVGMRASGSHHVALEDAFVADPFTLALGKMGTRLQARTNIIAMLHLGAVAVGIAEGALQDITGLVLSGRQRLYSPTSLRDSALAQHAFGKAEADVKAARAYLHAEAQSCDDAGEQDDWQALTSTAAQAAYWAAQVCTAAVDSLFAVAGGTSIQSSSPLQRRLRDVHTLLQHTLIQPRNFAGAALQRWGVPANALRMSS
jgi:alkylation response protein AidB-like acyl-CoA dehydrogenase